MTTSSLLFNLYLREIQPFGTEESVLYKAFAQFAVTLSTEEDRVPREELPNIRAEGYPATQWLSFSDSSVLRIEYSKDGTIISVRAYDVVDYTVPNVGNIESMEEE